MKYLQVSAVALGLSVTGGVAVAQDCPENLPTIEPGKLTMSINATLPPRQFLDADGNLQGLHPDLGNEIAARLCLEPVYMNVGFEVQIPGLASRRWDMVNTGMYYNPERAKIMRMVPYVVNALAIVVEGGNPLGVEGYEDLAGQPVGTEISGFADNLIREINAEQVANGMESMDIQAFNTFGDAFAALGAGQVRAVFGPDATAAYLAERGSFDVGASGLNPGLPSSFGFDGETGEELANAVADVLRDMVEDGTYDEMMSAYGATQIQFWDDYTGDVAIYYNPE
ncbi:MAG: ABC transporter substrate-binding protein [Rhizobiales bacterium]|nr:ABC transporter substrate-binding protein [Hyphomicrobiales bacterium]MBO6700357.1 ABC transporter substrate-binding protein [Hyphomicrobiales bacterium]MBO6737479.1 ABC transporter substrate-binding protein [Hyphomicrobiales bacterium]MBO6913464.1 ABC transporter substrate-binding protein [Hyphomicrobiales bacterium]MBO6955395.1 ABC transporter substrate-binding protein [Hyphomicrobiales bacterium]